MTKAKVHGVHSKKPVFDGEHGQVYRENYYEARGEYHDELMGAAKTIGFETAEVYCTVTESGTDVRILLFGPYIEYEHGMEAKTLMDTQFTASNIVSGLEEAGQRVLQHAAEIQRITAELELA